MNCTNLSPYGSLRRGSYNCWRDIEEMELVESRDTLRGYYMRTHGGFPAIFEGGEDDVVVVEVLDMTTSPDWERTFHAIDGMEFGCGYFRRLVRTEKGHEAWVYVMPKEEEHRFPIKIESGDWMNFEGGL